MRTEQEKWATRLSVEDYARAEKLARYEAEAALRNRRNSYNERSFEKRLEDGIKGKLGEIAGEIIFGTTVAPSKERGFVDQADLANGLEVRATHWPRGHLQVFPRDKDWRVYVLCICPEHGIDGLFRMVGWMTGAEAKSCGEYSEKWQPHYRVAQHQLHAMDKLVLGGK